MGANRVESFANELGRIVDQSQNEILVVDRESLRFLYANAAACRNLGYSLEELRRLGPADVTGGSSQEKIVEKLKPLVDGSGKRLVMIEGSHKRRDGSTYPVEIDVELVEYAGRACYFSMVRDISEKLNTLQRMNTVVREAAIGYWDLNLRTQKIYVNDRYLDILGLTREDITGVDVRTIRVHPDDLAMVKESFTACVTRNQPYIIEYRMLHKQGHWVWVRESGVVVTRDSATGEAIRVGGTHVDISVRRQMELEREQFYRFFQESQDMMVIADPKGGFFTRVNPATQTILGYTEEELLSRPFIDFIHPDDRSLTRTEIRHQVSTGTSNHFENRYIRKDGSVCWLSWCATFDDAEGVGYGTARDITDYKRVMENLHEKESTYRSLAENSNDVIMQYDRHHRHIYTNRAAGALIGISPEEFQGKTHEEMGFPADLCKLWRESIDKVFESGNPDSFTFEAPSPQGTLYVDWRAFPALNQDGKVETVISVARDITEYKRHEEEVERVQRLSSLGLLAGGIAHDFNNILTIIFGNISLGIGQLPDDHPVRSCLEDAEAGYLRATRLTSQLLTFAKGGDPIVKDISIRELVEEEIRFDLSGSNVKLVITSAPDLWLAKVDRSQIIQVFSNLSFNAIQAMPKGGSLYISMENARITPEMSNGLAAGRYLRFTVRDEGMGIEKQNLGKIFDPYFSTKKGGSGLGLATVYSVIHKHGGSIQVQSTMGEGTTFEFYLPASEQDVVEPEQKMTPVTAAKAPPGKILIMDDEDMIVDLALTVLEGAGHIVAHAADGKQALAAYREALDKREPFDLVIMDLTIPGGMGGLETMQELLKLDPAVQVIVSSGYADDPIMANHKSHGFRDVLVKPFTLRGLREAVAKALGSRPHQKKHAAS